MLVNNAELRLKIMLRATEDLTGLWELVEIYPSSIDLVIDTLRNLIDEQMVEIYSDETVLPTFLAREEINNRRFWNWDAPDCGSHLLVMATDIGRKWYFKEMWDFVRMET
jgi:hypothetical protein